MERSKLFLVFDTLTKKELRELKKFISSPFFNQQKEVIRLLEFLVKCKQHLKILPTKEKAFQVILPQQQFSDVKMRLLMSDLHKLVEKYLMYKNHLGDEILNKIKLASIYRERNLFKHFEKTIDNTSNLLEKKEWKDGEYYYLKYQELYEKYEFSIRYKRKGEYDMQEMTNTLDITFIILKLRQTCLLLTYKAYFNKEYELGLFPYMIQYVEQNDMLKIPSVSFYYFCYKTLIEPQKFENFTKFKNLIIEYSDKFTKSERKEFYLFAINYCIRHVNQGRKRFVKEALVLYKQGLATGAFLENKMITRVVYQNIVGLAISEKELIWVDKFIHEYKGNLSKKHRKDAFNFSLVRLEYERKNYAHALKLLQKINHIDLVNNLTAKIIVLKIYFETKEYSALESHLEAMSIFIQRKKLMGYHRTTFQNTIKFFKKLLNTNLFDKKEKLKLKKEIQEEEKLIDKQWLLEQLS